jgi:hypothetical protein
MVPTNRGRQNMLHNKMEMSMNIRAYLMLPHLLRTPKSIKETSINCKLGDFSKISYEAKVKVKHSWYSPIIDPECSSRLRLPHFETVVT